MKLSILDQKRIQVLRKLNDCSFISKFYLAGGTGLSLICGYRESYDFDFFTQVAFEPEEIVFLLKEKFKSRDIEVVKSKKNFATLDLFIDGIQISFFEYTYPLIDELIVNEEFNNIKIASIIDIMCMKANAISQRGSKKDFFDLYQIINKLALSEEQFFKIIDNKFHDKNLIISLMYSMNYFVDADTEILPKTFVDYSWEAIKDFFIKFSRNITNNLLKEK